MEEFLKMCKYSNNYILIFHTLLNKMKESLIYISEKQRSNSEIRVYNIPLFEYYIDWLLIRKRQAEIVS